MKFIAYLEKLETVKYLSQTKRTGTPRQLAGKLQISERTVRRMVQQLRESGYPITYDRFRYTYTVTEDLKKTG